MPPPNPAEKLLHAPVSDLVDLLIKQFRRLLMERNLVLTTPQLEAIGQAVEAHQPLPQDAEAMLPLLRDFVSESEAELQTRFGLDFATSLATDMGGLKGWETTGEFIELANYKSNAELRISAGATLLVFLGDVRYLPHLLTVMDVDGGVMDVDAALAMRALCHVAGVDVAADDWLAQVRQWWMTYTA